MVGESEDKVTEEDKVLKKNKIKGGGKMTRKNIDVHRGATPCLLRAEFLHVILP